MDRTKIKITITILEEDKIIIISITNNLNKEDRLICSAGEEETSNNNNSKVALIITIYSTPKPKINNKIPLNLDNNHHNLTAA